MQKEFNGTSLALLLSLLVRFHSVCNASLLPLPFVFQTRDPSMGRLSVSIFEGDGTASNPARISILNDGRGIPVEVHKTEKVYVPELIFGQLLTGSNFSEESGSVTGGRHGYGAKLTNIFSLEFQVETADTARGLRYRQTWKSNMSVKGAPQIETWKGGREASMTKKGLNGNEVDEGKGGGDYTKITFVPDLKSEWIFFSVLLESCRNVQTLEDGVGSHRLHSSYMEPPFPSPFHSSYCSLFPSFFFHHYLPSQDLEFRMAASIWALRP